MSEGNKVSLFEILYKDNVPVNWADAEYELGMIQAWLTENQILYKIKRSDSGMLVKFIIFTNPEDATLFRLKFG